MEPKLTIELTATQIQNLGALLDLAVKGGGMQAAKVALPIQATLEMVVDAYNRANPAQPMPAAKTEQKEAA